METRIIISQIFILAVVVLIGALTGLAPDKLVSSVIILEASMPCMATVVIMAKEFGADDHIAVGNVFESTLLSILTLPVLVIAINKYF